MRLLTVGATLAGDQTHRGARTSHTTRRRCQGPLESGGNDVANGFVVVCSCRGSGGAAADHGRRAGRIRGTGVAAAVAAFSLIEIMFVLGTAATVSAVAVPETLASLDDSRTAAATRYVATRLQRTRMEAVSRSSSVAV